MHQDYAASIPSWPTGRVGRAAGLSCCDVYLVSRQVELLMQEDGIVVGVVSDVKEGCDCCAAAELNDDGRPHLSDAVRHLRVSVNATSPGQAQIHMLRGK